jgi:hypothetical protein
LDDKGAYKLHWTIDKENGVYHAGVEVKTAGWIGFGLSASGGMANSDVVIGWYKDGVLHFSDRFAKQQGVIPPVDAKQDYYNVAGGEIITTDTAPSSSKDLVNRPTKIGVSVAGSVIGVILIILITYLCIKKRKKHKVVVVGGASVIPQRDPHTAATTTPGTTASGGGEDGSAADTEPLKESEFSTK